MVLRGSPAHLGVRTCAEAAGQFPAHIQLDVRITHQERLRIGVDGDELHALEADFDHAVDGIDAAAADSDNFDDGEIVLRYGHDAPFTWW